MGSNDQEAQIQAQIKIMDKTRQQKRVNLLNEKRNIENILEAD